MGRSKVERLPEPIRAQLEDWLRDAIAGRLTLDEVMLRFDAQFADQLGEDAPSRSAVHRHAQKFEAISARMKKSREIAEMLVAEAGPQLADGKGFQVLVQGFHSLAFDLLANVDDEKPFDPENLMFFARAIQSVASAQKTDADRALKLKLEAKKEAVAEVEKVAKQEGLSNDTLNRIRAGILGVAPK
ncbi:DUF3486 family protein [Brevundimonas sp.]|uniref:DUF3486 family protein n=1 Tax=Brevundimonas sp. TaxID=1871086 RepID=UPI003F70F427